MPRLHLLPSRISKFSEGRPPDPLPIKRGDIPLSHSRLRRSGHAYVQFPPRHGVIIICNRNQL
jgi:hypothetical protein